MDKIVFLDIDGVLNTPGDKNLIDDTFEETKSKNLVHLLQDTKSNLVIISDRRLIAEERKACAWSMKFTEVVMGLPLQF